MPATSIFISAASSAISGIGYSRISVLLGPTRTAANTFSATLFSDKENLRALGHVLIHVHFDPAREHRAPRLDEISRHRIARDLLPVQLERLFGLIFDDLQHITR